MMVNWHHVAFSQEKGDYMKDAILYVDGEVAETEPSTVEGYNCVDVVLGMLMLATGMI